MRKILLLFSAVVFSWVAYAQDITVSGRVTSAEDGTTLPGVNVLLKGTGVGTVSDADGHYSISVPGAGSLVFSFIGLKTQEIQINGRTIIDISLALDATELSEVVVTALNVSREAKTLPYATQTVKAENLNLTQDVDIKGALSGKVAGVQVLSQAGSKLGAFGGIRIRGALSITKDQEPLYVLDGVPVPDPNDIDMNNIESINVLKGPNANALYGQRGAFGVVLLTSRKGAKGSGLSVEFQSATTVDKVSYLPKMQNLYGGGYDGEDSFATFDLSSLGSNALPEWSVFNGKRYIQWDNNYADESWGPKFDGQDYVPWYAWWPNSPYFGQTAKYVAQPDNIRDFYETGVQSKNTISLRGGGSNYSVNLSYSNFQQKGVTPYTDYTKHFVLANFTLEASDKLSITSNIRYTNSLIKGNFNDGYGNQTTGSFNSWFNRNLEMDKLRELRNLTTPDGYSASWNWWGPDYYALLGGGFKKAAFWFNPYTFMEKFEQDQFKENIAGNISASYAITNDLTVNAALTRSNIEFKRDYRVPFFLSNSSAPELYNSWSNGFGTWQNQESENNYSADVRYKKTFSDFDLNAIVGGNLRHDFYRRIVADMPIGAKTGGLIIPDLYLYSNAGNPPVPVPFFREKKVRSAYANLSLGYKGVLYFDGSLRRDWDSALPKSKNGFTYGSVGLNWIFGELLNVDFLTFGKVRGSWAQNGQEVDALEITSNIYETAAQAFQGSTVVQFAPGSLIDPNLVVPKNTSIEFGLDLKFLQNRLNLSATYFDEKSGDNIIGIQIPSATGADEYVTNAGTSSRRGIELSLDGDVLKTSSGLTWNVLVNFSKMKTTIDELPAGYNSVAAPGGVGTFGFVAMTHELGNDWGQLRGTAIKRDANGTPILQSNGNYDIEFNQYLGSVQPDFFGGLVNRLNYKGFTLSISIDYQKGGKFFSLSEMWGSYSGLLEATAATNDKGMNVRDDVAEGGGVHVTGVDAGGNPVDMYVPATQYFGQFYSNRLAEPFTHDKSYIKLREVGLQYNLMKILKVGFIKGATIGVVGRHLALLAVAKGNIHRWDPTQFSTRYGENGQLPGIRSYGVNLNLKF